MQEVNDSLYLVINSVNFWWYMSTVISLGMVIGAKYDDRFNGFKKSVTLIAPYASIILLTTVSRVYETSKLTPLNPNAYNSLWTLFIITIFYVLGLFIGHMIDNRARVAVQKEIKIEEKKEQMNVIAQNTEEIKSDVKEILDK